MNLCRYCLIEEGRTSEFDLCPEDGDAPHEFEPAGKVAKQVERLYFQAAAERNKATRLLRELAFEARNVRETGNGIEELLSKVISYVEK